MATDKKISELPAATVPLSGTEKLEILQGGVNKQVDASDVGGGASGSYLPLTLTANEEVTGDFDLQLGTSANHLNSLSIYTETSMLIHAQDAFQVDIHDDITTDIVTIVSTPKQINIQAGDAAQTIFQINDEDGGSGVLIQTTANPISIDAGSSDVTLDGATVTAPTPAAGTNNTEVATTAFVQAANLGSVSTSTAGATITLDMGSLVQRMHIGSATFSAAKAVAMSNATNALQFQFIFEVTNVAAVLTVPADWLMSSADFDGTDWTPPGTGKFMFGGAFDGTNWYVNVAGPFV